MEKEQPWDISTESTHVSDGTHESIVFDHGDEQAISHLVARLEEMSVHKELRGVSEMFAASNSLNQPSGLYLTSESRQVDAAKVKTLLNIKALSQDQALAGDRRKASSAYLGTGRTVGDRESKDISKLLRNLRQQTWKKSATTGNAEPLLRHVCMCVRVCVSVHVRGVSHRICQCARVHLCINACVHTCMRVCLCVCKCACAFVFASVTVCVRVLVRMLV